MGKKGTVRSHRQNHVRRIQQPEDLDALHAGEIRRIEDTEKPAKDQTENFVSQVEEVETKRTLSSELDDELDAEFDALSSEPSGLVGKQRKSNRKQRKGKQCAGAMQPPRETEITHGHLRLAACKSLSIGPLIDIGANLTKPQCKVPQDLARQLVRAAAAGVDHIILTGHSVESSQDARKICETWNRDAVDHLLQKHLGRAAMKELEDVSLQDCIPHLTYTAGIHPHEAISCNRDTLNELRGLAAHDLCVSIGECGLDYHRMFSPRAIQLKWCEKQVALAVELGMPIFLHERDQDSQPYKGKPLGSFHDLLNILERCRVLPGRVCIHCFTGSCAELKAYVDKGFFIGLTGSVGMQQRFAHLRQSLKDGALPLSQLMLETDCPFMMPDKHYLPSELGMQGQRNEPCGMLGVCQAVAECVGRTPQEIASITTENAAKFFGLHVSSGGCARRHDLQQRPALCTMMSESTAVHSDKEGIDDEREVAAAEEESKMVFPATCSRFSVLVADDASENESEEEAENSREV